MMEKEEEKGQSQIFVYFVYCGCLVPFPCLVCKPRSLFPFAIRDENQQRQQLPRISPYCTFLTIGRSLYPNLEVTINVDIR